MSVSWSPLLTFLSNTVCIMIIMSFNVPLVFWHKACTYLICYRFYVCGDFLSLHLKNSHIRLLNNILCQLNLSKTLFVWMCLHMHVQMGVHLSVYSRKYMCVCVLAWIHICVCPCKSMCSMSAYVHMCTYTCVCLQVYICVYLYVCNVWYGMYEWMYMVHAKS